MYNVLFALMLGFCLYYSIYTILTKRSPEHNTVFNEIDPYSTIKGDNNFSMFFNQDWLENKNNVNSIIEKQNIITGKVITTKKEIENNKTVKF